jgi:two-component system sensor histidine kinase VicK
MLVVFVVLGSGMPAYIASAIIIAALIVAWRVYFWRIFYSEAEFFDALATDLNRLRRLEAAVRKIEDGVVIITENKELILINETAKKYLAVVDGDLDGSRYDEYAADFSGKLARSMILDAAKEGKPPVTIEMKEKTFRIGYVAVRSKKEELLGAVAVISDVTDRTNLENMQIDFVANVSHELKTPLTSIRGYAETLMTGAVDDEEMIKEFLSIIVSCADDMDSRIRKQLFYSRTKYTGIRIDASEEDLTALVRMSMKKLDIVARKKSLTLFQMFADKRVPIEIDRDGIEQVMQNILGNAIKYTDEKGRIDVDIIQDKNCVQIVISDNGMGIPEDDLSRVFEPYYMVDKSRAGNREGSGLGLAISKQFVDAHGGSISIESTLGLGTTITVSLPTSGLRGTPGIQ